MLQMMGNMVVEIGGYQGKRLDRYKTNSGHFISLFERRTENTFAQRHGSSDMPLEKIKINKERLQTSVFLLFLRNTFESLINSVLTQIICLLLEY
jgi:hypothetical protein